jgi:putative salt-induced outer membrane protein
MMSFKKTAAASTLALLVAAPAFAQGALVGTEGLDDRIDDTQREIRDDLREGSDADRFGQARFRPGWSGSMSLGYSGTTGNSETQDLTVAGRVRRGGVINQTLGFGLEFSESTDQETDETVTDEEEVFLVYEANRDLTDRLYAFGLGSYRNDDFDSLQQDALIAAGPGFRIINQQDLAWRVQAGPAVRWTETNDSAALVTNADERGIEETEVAGLVGSRFFYRFAQNVSLTNDTDVIYSDEAGTLVQNDFGVNLELNERITTRISYRTDYNSDPVEGRDNTDNRLGVALVFGL